MNCLFVHDFRSYSRDGEIYTGNLSYEIWKERYIKYFENVRVLNRSGEMEETDSPSRYVKASGPNVEFLNEIDVFTPISFALNINSYKKIVYKHVDDAEYVIIRLDSFLGLIAAKRCRETGKKYLIEVVGCVWDSFWNKGAYGKLVAYPLLKRMQKEILVAPYVVYVTEKFLQSRYPTRGKSTNISNVLLPKHDDTVLTRRLERIEVRQDSPFEIVTVASVSVRYKGQESVIKALGELKKQGNSNFIYHLIGTGNSDYLKSIAKSEEIEDRVIFHGGMKHDDVISFLDKCDIYIQPSKQEGLPRSLIEGMSRGMLCFGTRVAGIPELLDPSMLFSKRNENYQEIACLLNKITPDEYKAQAARNFKEAKKYEIDVLSQRRERFFTEFRDNV